MFKFIYTTDLHGNCTKFNNILDFAIKEKISLIHLGSDFLPKSRDILEKQQDFISNFFIPYYKRAQENNIKIFVFFGNDDLYCLKNNLRKNNINLLDETEENFEGYKFIAYPYVCDHPFGLKHASKLDYSGWERPPCDYGVEILKTHTKSIPDIDFYLSQKTTIEKDLKKIKADNKTIMSFHMPPSKLGMDACYTREQNVYVYVGSDSIYNWIEKEQPIISLHGHIHESYDITKIWKSDLGKTLVIQPGQMQLNRFVVLEVDGEKVTPCLKFL